MIDLEIKVWITQPFWEQVNNTLQRNAYFKQEGPIHQIIEYS